MRLENFYVVGIDHKKLGLEEREGFTQTKPSQIIEKLYLENKIHGYVDLSTCLRVEFYMHLKDGDINLEGLFAGQKGIFIKKGEEALDYLFRVICGFESVIKGEDQILAQIKNAYDKSFTSKKSSKILNIIFNRAIEIGKKFRTESKIAHNALSLEAISLKFIKNNIEELNKKKVLILGTGELAQDILYLLKKDGVEDITITNRSVRRAIEVKNTYNVNMIGFEDKNKGVIESEVIISITSAPHYILKSEELMLPLDDNRERVFLDLAVPRDVDEKLGELDNIKLYNLDDVWEVYRKNVGNREGKLEEFYYLLEEQKEVVKKWFYYREKLERELDNI